MLRMLDYASSSSLKYVAKSGQISARRAYDSALPRRSEFVAEMTADAMAAPRSSTMMSCVSWMRNRTKNVT